MRLMAGVFQPYSSACQDACKGSYCQKMSHGFDAHSSAHFRHLLKPFAFLNLQVNSSIYLARKNCGESQSSREYPEIWKGKSRKRISIWSSNFELSATIQRHRPYQTLAIFTHAVSWETLSLKNLWKARCLKISSEDARWWPRLLLATPLSSLIMGIRKIS